MRRLAPLALSLSLLLFLGCGSPPPAPEPTPPAVEPSPPSPTRAELVAAADARRVDEGVERGLMAPDAGIRREATLAVARLHDPGQLALLRRGLGDTDPAVRRAASLGIGALGSDAPSEATSILAGALAAEDDPPTRAAMLRDLGRLGTENGMRAVIPALESVEAGEREAACYALAERGMSGDDVPAAVRGRVASLLDGQQPTDVRLACAFALARLPAATDAQANQGVVVALGIAAADVDPDVRGYAYRALGRHAGADLATLAHGVADADWRVSVQAVQALARQTGTQQANPTTLAAAIAALYEGLDLESPRIHAFFAALAAAAPFARQGPIHDLAARLHQALERIPDGGVADRARGLAHCAAAELVDRGRGWPSRLERCGLEQVEEPLRQIYEARVLGDLDGADEQRLVRLRRLFAVETPAVREAVVGAAAKIVHPDATTLVLEALAVDDAGIRAASAEALATIARRRPTAELLPPPLPVEPAVAALRNARAQTPDPELETLVTWIDAVDAVDARGLVDEIRSLALHPSRAVRDRARQLLTRWEATLPDGEPPPPPDLVTTIPDAASRPRVALTTRFGDVVLELRPDLAPTTVARFLQLVEAGFYDGLRFHRVVPAFVVQGGDPRGDGYGGPAFWQRCEDHRLPYRRGTVGMALAGRDTGGSQFFVTYGAQPHLEGRYTAFAEVVEGMEHVDRLLEGDAILRARRRGAP